MTDRSVSAILCFVTLAFAAASAQGQTRQSSNPSDLKTNDRLANSTSNAVQDPNSEPPLSPHRFSIFGAWGLDNSFAGNMIKQADGQTISGVPINLSQTTFDDVYGRMAMFKVGVAYRWKPRVEDVGEIVIERSGAQQVSIGTASAAHIPLTVQFDDYSYKGFEAGQHLLFARPRFTPYAGYLVGFVRTNDIHGVFVNVPAGVTPGLANQDGIFFDRGWVFTWGPTGGLTVPVGHIEILAEAQLRYVGGLSDVNWLVEEGLKDINTESARWSVPFVIGARYRF